MDRRARPRSAAGRVDRGTRSYGLGLARAVTAAGLLLVECEQPNRTARRGKGKSDPIDAHLAVLTALRMDADRLPGPRADGDREALRILLGTRHELTTTSTAQVNRLRALLLAGDDTDRHIACGAVTDAGSTISLSISVRMPAAAGNVPIRGGCPGPPRRVAGTEPEKPTSGPTVNCMIWGMSTSAGLSTPRAARCC